MESSKTNKVLRSSPNYILRTIAGQDVLVSIGEGLADFRGYIQINDSAAFLWRQLQEGRTKEELLHALREAYEVDEETARRDLDSCLELLSAKGMVLE